MNSVMKTKSNKSYEKREKYPQNNDANVNVNDHDCHDDVPVKCKGSKYKNRSIEDFFPAQNNQFKCKRPRFSKAPELSDQTKLRLKSFSLQERGVFSHCEEENSNGNEIVESQIKKNRSSDEEAPGAKRIKRSSESKKTTLLKYTPLEQQYIDFKSQNNDVILFIQCGYKYRFFDSDAEIAAQELNIMAHLDHNFMTASIPIYRLHVHVKCLVAKGYKVGVVKQTETAALKSGGGNKNNLFERRLTDLYTKATLIGEDILLSIIIFSVALQTQFITDPCTGDLIYDIIEDGPQRCELEQRLTQIDPTEILIPQTLLTATTSFLIESFINERNKDGNNCRLEKKTDSDFSYTDALVLSTNLLSEDEAINNYSDILNKPKVVIQCFGALHKHLKNFKLQRILFHSKLLKWNNEQKYMFLTTSTISNLELFKSNSFDNKNGSLWKILNRTKTKFGSRLLRQWLCFPSINKSEINIRLDIISEILHSSSSIITTFRELLKTLPDLERGITAMFHSKVKETQHDEEEDTTVEERETMYEHSRRRDTRDDEETE
ncbi:DNA mismatch repair protein Msh3 [Nymphon striatum]|nr:DNA mismatch repair protein Msh3 [Nymphon striatum]